MPGKFLAEFELYVMLAIARLDAEAYGAAVRQEIEERTGRPVSVGALYATLTRLTDKGLVAQTAVEAEPRSRGRPRKYCRLTKKGAAAVQHSTEMLARMSRGLKFEKGGAR